MKEKSEQERESLTTPPEQPPPQTTKEQRAASLPAKYTDYVMNTVKRNAKPEGLAKDGENKEAAPVSDDSDETTVKKIAENEIQTMRKEIEQLKRNHLEEAGELKDAVEKMRNNLKLKEQTLASAREELSTINQRHTECKQHLAKVEDSNKALKTKNDNLLEENRKNKKQVQELNKTNDQLQSENNDLKQKNQMLNDTLEECLKRNNELEEKNAKHTEEEQIQQLTDETRREQNGTVQQPTVQPETEARSRIGNNDQNQRSRKKVNKLCRFALRKKCRYDAAECQYIHPEKERLNDNNALSSRICRQYNSEGGCRQANCRYLHAYKKSETCRRYNGEQGCRYGRYCIYNHAKAQTQPGAKNGEPKTIRSETPAKNDQCAQLEKLMESVANLTRLMTTNMQAQQQNGNISRQQENYTHQYQQPQQTNLQTAQPQIHTYPYNATSMSQPIPPVTYYTQTN